ncbi:ferritin-like domain-containing protein [endosymbiont of unidentified scaly snail isolate Monju]|uniref:ferritin-like domain-containing protein n=1 Tax=endosymbiont of unidentified scaly snail isolate Monju TaxID=1248727 RepID=UPI0003892377|nr:ferritin-like domain-containing protein [endosymbiont of unidentified scaly snail isolate Monju]BAN68749.1 conserved hypothetical protein [endosymbiont of unidentified scaly snail isolate Monju]
MPRNLHAAAHECLLTADIDSKLEQARALDAEWRAGRLHCASVVLPDVTEPGRPARPELVPPSQVPQRRIGTPEGHAALIHAVAHIEFNAINLACDAAWRFQGLPEAYYADWLRVAAEEAHHFTLLRDRLRALGYDYGDFAAHDGLWELARKTADDPLRRMALVPRVMEARGLDVTPGMMKRFAHIGDTETVAILEVILRDEVGHVEAGTRWFRHLCRERGLEPEKHYFELLEAAFGERMRCPLHKAARRQAGFSETELQRLEAMCKD